jgi:hypothetical protein
METPFKTLGKVLGAQVWVRREGGDQTIVLSWQAPHAGPMELVRAIAGQQFVLKREGGRGRVTVEIPHSEEVDRRLVEIADLLVAIRYAHPTMTQLRLQLGPEDGALEGRPALERRCG